MGFGHRMRKSQLEANDLGQPLPCTSGALEHCGGPQVLHDAGLVVLHLQPRHLNEQFRLALRWVAGLLAILDTADACCNDPAAARALLLPIDEHIGFAFTSAHFRVQARVATVTSEKSAAM
eukprot:CAMPEP_0183600238 /NCGR_PEP_ID=MMETSP0371-20130417/179834_1 /TAXON_ID=268820 /ORGANISM="Peridinium aciculiferum, Strain PAER-2" /LENGTH=120 /DNA_ID=CAMNT_0025812311 /DNA_START=615 /DNA_END=978 /DNA_ORIENTATION=+